MKSKVFIIMPFKDEFFDVYEMLKNKFSEKFEFTNAGDEDNQQNILRDIIQPIYDADVVIADLTGQNANVLYELGVAHTLNKKCIVITKDELSTLPFDLKQYRAKNYDIHFRKFEELLEYLEKNLQGAVDNTVVFGNPVSDFLQTIPNEELLNKQKTVQQVDTDKGFWDFIEEIGQGMGKLTLNIRNMSEDMCSLSEGVDERTKQITKANVKGGSGQPSFIRKETKKIAELMTIFTNKLNSYNSDNLDVWNNVEVNIFGLFENKHLLKEEFMEDFRQYLVSLDALNISIVETNKSINFARESSNSILGFEKSLNQAIHILDAEFKTYLNSMEQICASIERIKIKGQNIISKF